MKSADSSESPFISSMIFLKKKGTSIFKTLARSNNEKAIITRILTDQLSFGHMYLNNVFKILISEIVSALLVVCSLNLILF